MSSEVHSGKRTCLTQMPKTFERLLLCSVMLLMAGGLPAAVVHPVLRQGPFLPRLLDSTNPAILERALDVDRLPVRFKSPLQSVGDRLALRAEKPKLPRLSPDRSDTVAPSPGVLVVHCDRSPPFHLSVLLSVSLTY